MFNYDPENDRAFIPLAEMPLPPSPDEDGRFRVEEELREEAGQGGLRGQLHGRVYRGIDHCMYVTCFSVGGSNADSSENSFSTSLVLPFSVIRSARESRISPCASHKYICAS